MDKLGLLNVHLSRSDFSGKIRTEEISSFFQQAELIVRHLRKGGVVLPFFI
jgi:hypothetical protein